MPLQANPNIPCKILKETKDYLFLYKPPFVHSVPLDEEETNSVSNWLISVDSKLSQIFPLLECGLAHRLDYEASGVMVAAKNQKTYDYLRKCFSQNQIYKEYVCVVSNPPPKSGIYEAYVDKKRSKSKKKIYIKSRGEVTSSIQSVIQIITEILSSKKVGTYYEVRINLITGFRHQIRAHLTYLGCPIVGDKLYEGVPAEGLMLFADKIKFKDFNGNGLEAQLPIPYSSYIHMNKGIASIITNPSDL